AARQGAAGAIVIHTTESATYPWQVVQSSWSGTQYSLPATAGEPALGLKAWVTEETARALARHGNQDLDALRQAARRRGAKAAVVEVAQAFARAPVKPQRSIYVLFTTAEESGLLGSEYFAAHLPLPADQWAADINIDEINLYGPTKDIVLLGGDRSSLGPMAG